MFKDYLNKIIPESNLKFNFMRKIFMPRMVINGNFFEYIKNIQLASPFCIVSGAVAKKFDKQLKTAPFSQGIVVKNTGEPTEKLVKLLIKRCTGSKYDSVIGIGGGSTLDLAKAIKKEVDLPLIISPSTPSSGSETTPYVLMVNDQTKSKMLIRSAQLIPDVVVLDSSFLESIPLQKMGYFLFDILAHCVEGLASKMANTFSDSFACKGIEMIFYAAKKLGRPYPKEVLELLQTAGFLGGLTQGMASVGMAHSLAHYFGPKYNISHSKSVSIFLPEVIQINAAQSKIYEKMKISTGRDLKKLFSLFDDIRKVSGISNNKIKVEKNFSAEKAISAIQKDFCSPTNPIRFDNTDFLKIFKNTLC